MGERALRAKLDALRNELDVEFRSRFQEAWSFGGAGQNDDYLQAKEEEAILLSRIDRLQRLLDQAVVVSADEDDGDFVTVGSVVSVEDIDSGSVVEYRLIGGFEEVLTGISVDSPIGRALIGKVAGDQVEAELPGGRRRRLRIIATSWEK